MKKPELLKRVSKAVNIKEEEVTVVFDAVVEEIIKALKAGEEIKIHNFGRFETREYGKRKCYNPISKELITLEPSVQPAFVPSGKFREKIK